MFAGELLMANPMSELRDATTDELRDQATWDADARDEMALRLRSAQESCRKWNELASRHAGIADDDDGTRRLLESYIGVLKDRCWEWEGRAAKACVTPSPECSCTGCSFSKLADEVAAAACHVQRLTMTSRVRRERDRLLKKHGVDIHGLIGFVKGVPCLCSLLRAISEEPPCIPCRAKAYSDEFRAFVRTL